MHRVYWGQLKTHTPDTDTHGACVTSYLSSAQLEEYVDVFVIFEMMGEFHHMLVGQGFVQLDLICDLSKFNSRSTCDPILGVAQSGCSNQSHLLNMTNRVPCPSGVVWTPCSVESPSLHTFCWWKGPSSHSIVRNHPLGEQRQDDELKQQVENLQWP